MSSSGMAAVDIGKSVQFSSSKTGDSLRQPSQYNLTLAAVSCTHLTSAVYRRQHKKQHHNADSHDAAASHDEHSDSSLSKDRLPLRDAQS